MAYLDLMRVSVLVNGSLSKKFSPKRGLRQGDPLSPLLYNIMAEVLNLMIKRAVSKGMLRGIILDGYSEQLTHLQFADDTLIFIEGSVDSVMSIKRVLQCF